MSLYIYVAVGLVGYFSTAGINTIPYVFVPRYLSIQYYTEILIMGLEL